MDGSEASIPALGIRVVVERRVHQTQRAGLLGTAGSCAVEHDDGPGTTRCPGTCRWIAIVCSSGGKIPAVTGLMAVLCSVLAVSITSG
jgi:hypothetical protein